MVLHRDISLIELGPKKRRDRRTREHAMLILTPFQISSWVKFDFSYINAARHCVKFTGLLGQCNESDVVGFFLSSSGFRYSSSAKLTLAVAMTVFS